MSTHGDVRLGPPRRGERLLWGVLRAILLAKARVFFRLRVSGLQHVPAKGPFILAPVHRSNLDFLVVLICAKRRMRYLAKDSLWKFPFDLLWNALGGIPVARGTADRAALQACVDVVQAGEPLVMFPEGARQFGPTVEVLFDGPAFVQSRTGAPIVPVGIGGSEAAMPKGKKLMRPKRITVVIGAPITAPEHEGAKARRSSVRSQSAILRGRLQILFDDAQRRAGTPNRPEVEPEIEPEIA